MGVKTAYEDLIGKDVADVRAAIRCGGYCGQTAGLAPGKLQANLAILHRDLADDFESYCRLNPQPCPLVGVTGVGNPDWSALGSIDVRTDAPSYNVYRDGSFQQSVRDLSPLWNSDLVAFALGCSFTFETALAAAGVPMAHIEANKTVPMYRTNIETTPAGPFRGGMVVSLRFIPTEMVDLASEITARYPWAHGAPVHIGDPAQIGISDIAAPDWGDPPVTTVGEPMFWACGVTPQNALEAARPALCITHTPGHMLITDIDDQTNSFLR